LTVSARDGINFCGNPHGESFLGETTDEDQVLLVAARILSKRRLSRIAEIVQMDSVIDWINREIDKTIHSNSQPAESKSAKDVRIRKDLFLGLRLSTAVQECLKLRSEAIHAGEILNLLKEGGFAMDSLGSSEDMQLAKLTKTLRKNTKTFRRIPNGAFGLVAWYSNGFDSRE
jgi:hypothetical protein